MTMKSTGEKEEVNPLLLPEQEQSIDSDHGGDGAGEWRRGPLLGTGTFGSVHMATVVEPRAPRFRDFPPVMAVKSSHGSRTRSELERERRLLRYLRNCPFVIQYLGEEETSTDNGESQLSVFLEFASGGTLASLIKSSDGPLDEGLVRRHARSILAGVKRIHDEGFVHCDLKPENVLLVGEDPDFVAKVADLGLAKLEKQSGFGVRGTLFYSAPEAVRYNVQEKPSDIWALGCVVLEMLGGKLPWEESKLARREVRRRIATETPLFPEETSWEAANFLAKCFMRNPDNRATAEELTKHPFVCRDKGEAGGDYGLSDSIFYLTYYSSYDDDDDDDYDDDCSFVSIFEAMESKAEEEEGGGCSCQQRTMHEAMNEGRETTLRVFWGKAIDLLGRVWSVQSPVTVYCVMSCGTLLCNVYAKLSLGFSRIKTLLYRVYGGVRKFFLGKL